MPIVNIFMSDLYIYTFSITYPPCAFLHWSPYNASSMLCATSLEGNVAFQWVLRVQILLSWHKADFLLASLKAPMGPSQLRMFCGPGVLIKLSLSQTISPGRFVFLRAHFHFNSFYFFFFLLLPCSCWDRISFLRHLFGSTEARSNLMHSFKMLNKHHCLREMHLFAFSSL